MVTIFICIGLIAIPLLPLVGFHGNENLMGASLFIATVLCLWGYTQEQKPFRNKWLLFFCAYLLISTWQAPYPNIILFNNPIAHFWVWGSMFSAFIYLGMYKTISESKISFKNKDLIFDIIMYSILTMAVYCIGQRFGLMQWFTSVGGNNSPNPNLVGGTLGSPAYVSPYLVAGLPFGLYRKKYLYTILISIAIILTDSQVAMIAGVITLATLACFKLPKLKYYIISLILLAGIVLTTGKVLQYKPIDELVNDSTRFQTWTVILDSINKPYGSEKAYPWTGRGPGAFKWTNMQSNGNNFREAHNEYIEVLYDTGIIGAFLFIMSLFYFFKNIKLTPRNHYLVSAFIGLCVCAGGIFVWHLGMTVFLTVVLIGLIDNEGAC
jgi:O-antigen ligase